MSYLQLQADRATDILVAEKIFGWKRSEKVCGAGDYFIEGTFIQWWNGPNGEFVTKHNDGSFSSVIGRVPYYSSYIEDAWLLVNLITERYGLFLSLTKDEEGWECWITNLDPGDYPPSVNSMAQAETASLAIVRAVCNEYAR